jgi:hypothetical protein
VAIAYGIVAVFLFALSRTPEIASATIEKDAAAIAATPAE